MAETQYLDLPEESIVKFENMPLPEHPRRWRVVFEKGRAGETSDGYHTFDDLYEHRMALTLALMQSHPELSWKSKKHHPSDDKMFENFFIVGINTPAGVITYHYKLEHWDTFLGIRELPHAPAWDKATPDDTPKRIRKWARQIKKENK
jgi:hypothetical protein